MDYWLRCADELQPDRCDQTGPKRANRARMSGARVELLVHGVVQGLDAPSHGQQSIVKLL